MNSYDDVMEEGWKDLVRYLKKEYRKGFECGYYGRYMELEPRTSDAYAQGFARGYELAQMEYAASAAPEQGYEDVTYEQMAKGA